MVRWFLTWGAAVVAAIALAVPVPASALAAWRSSNTTFTSIAYNQGIAFDQARGSFFLDGVVSTTNSGVYRTSAALSLQAVGFSVIPHTVEGYNHAGDLSFDPGRPGFSSATSSGSTGGPGSPRLLLPLECYYPSQGGNTCGTGAIGVASPMDLHFLYYVNLDRAQIQKAMWDEVSPDGRWIWTSSGTHLLAYPSASVNPSTAADQRAGTTGGIVGQDLGSVLPSAGVTGAAFYIAPGTPVPRLLLSLNLGTSFEVVSYPTGTAPDGSPILLSSTPTIEITVPKSFNDSEPEGLAVTGPFHGSYPLGGVLHWQMLPAIPLYSSILNYLPSP